MNDQIISRHNLCSAGFRSSNKPFGGSTIENRKLYYTAHLRKYSDIFADGVKIIADFIVCSDFKQDDLKKGDFVDAMDCLGYWYTSIIIDIDDIDGFYIHFIGFESICREWVKARRIQLLGKHAGFRIWFSKKLEQKNMDGLRVGDFISEDTNLAHLRLKDIEKIKSDAMSYQIQGKIISMDRYRVKIRRDEYIHIVPRHNFQKWKIMKKISWTCPSCGTYRQGEYFCAACGFTH